MAPLWPLGHKYQGRAAGTWPGMVSEACGLWSEALEMMLKKRCISLGGP